MQRLVLCADLSVLSFFGRALKILGLARSKKVGQLLQGLHHVFPRFREQSSLLTATGRRRAQNLCLGKVVESRRLGQHLQRLARRWTNQAFFEGQALSIAQTLSQFQAGESLCGIPVRFAFEVRHHLPKLRDGRVPRPGGTVCVYRQNQTRREQHGGDRPHCQPSCLALADRFSLHAKVILLRAISVGPHHAELRQRSWPG